MASSWTVGERSRPGACDHLDGACQAQWRGDDKQALNAFRAASTLRPDTMEFAFWHAAALAHMRRIDDGLPLLRRACAQDRNWATLASRLAPRGFLPDDQALLKRFIEPGAASDPVIDQGSGPTPR